MPLQLCEHIFHSGCLKPYLESLVSESKFPLKCPDEKCKHDISDLDVKELLSEQLYQKYANFALNLAVEHQKDLSWCPTADCKFAFIFDQGAKDETNELNCPLCKQHYCLNCRVPFHKGQSCKQYQITSNPDKVEEAFVSFAKGKKFKQCPHCSFWVERTMGCDHMRCRCGKDFCYKCGGISGKCECVREA